MVATPMKTRRIITLIALVVIMCVVLTGVLIAVRNAGLWPTTRVTLTVAYSVAGGGSPQPPILSYLRGGISMDYVLSTTPSSIQADRNTDWSVSNPLSGSDENERWYSTQPLGGRVSTEQTFVIRYQHQYRLHLQVVPSNSGTTAPASGWQNAGATVSIQATATSEYAFLSWTGSGTGSYTGSSNPARITVSGAITETASFGQAEFTLTVSYEVIGGGAGYSPPFLNYVQGGISRVYALTTTPTAIRVDRDTAWSVSNPLGGSNENERWYTTQALTGKATDQTVVIKYQHQYRLYMEIVPLDTGTTIPNTSWQDAGATVTIDAFPMTGYAFKGWVGSGDGSYTGLQTAMTIIMVGTITEVANFTA